MKTISFGSAKNIGKKEKYYLKKYLYNKIAIRICIYAIYTKLTT
jgi:hypothetical protein